jgi:hypothetical protein
MAWYRATSTQAQNNIAEHFMPRPSSSHCALYGFSSLAYTCTVPYEFCHGMSCVTDYEHDNPDQPDQPAVPPPRRLQGSKTGRPHRNKASPSGESRTRSQPNNLKKLAVRRTLREVVKTSVRVLRSVAVTGREGNYSTERRSRSRRFSTLIVYSINRAVRDCATDRELRRTVSVRGNTRTD